MVGITHPRLPLKGPVLSEGGAGHSLAGSIMSAADDAALAAAVARGDHSAYEQLYWRHEDRVSRIVFAILRVRCVYPLDHAQEVRQEVWRKLWEGARQYDAERSFSHWLGALARNASIDHIKRCDTRLEPLDEKDGKGVSGEGPAEGAESRIIKRIFLRELWDKLTDDEREIGTLAYIEGLDGKELAQRLATTEGAAKLRKFRLGRKLQKLASQT